MPNYLQQNISSAQTYQRANKIIIENPLNDIPMVTYNEEMVYIFDGEVVLKNPCGSIDKILTNLEETFPIINPINDLPIPTTKNYKDVYVILYSVYRYLKTSLRDFPESPQINIEPSELELNEGTETTTFNFVIFRKGKLDNVSSIDWVVTASENSQISADDFDGGIFPSGTIEFAAGEFYKYLNIDVSGDSIAEEDELFNVTISNPVNGILGNSTVTATIKNDDIE